MGWFRKPLGQPAEIDPAPLRESIHRRLEALLQPLGFRREEDRWSLENGVRRSLALDEGLTSRTETKFSCA